MGFGAIGGANPDNQTLEISGGVLKIKDGGLSADAAGRAKMADGFTTPEKVGVASGVPVLVASQTLATVATSMSVSGLDLDAHKHYLIELRVIGGATGGEPKMTVNADTTATNYYSEYVYVTGASVTASNQNSPRILSLPVSTNAFAVIDLVKEAAGPPQAVSKTVQGAGVNTTFFQCAWVWNGTANVTGITITHEIANMLLAGSYIKVFRFK